MDILFDETTKDIDTSGIDLQHTGPLNSITQHLRQRLRMFKNEYFLDSRIGVPYHEQILRKNPNPTVVDSEFKKVIINTPGVEKLTKFLLDLDTATRELTVTFEAVTNEGVINFSEVLP